VTSSNLSVCSPLSFAEQSAAFTQCHALGNQEKFTEAEPFRQQAAAEPGKDGKRLYGVCGRAGRAVATLRRTGRVGGRIAR
jgi:hypothetical protein